MMNKFLQHQLYLANTAVYPEKSDFFYPLKAKLLKRYGTEDGYDIQHIVKCCWSCEGDGCYRCYQSGIYREDWHYLQNYKLGDRIYHIPVNTVHDSAVLKNEIEGLIQHDQIDLRAGVRAMYWLCLVYEPNTFWYLLRSQLTGSWHRTSVTCYASNSIVDFCLKFLLAIIVLFAGWLPVEIRPHSIIVIRPQWNPALEHVCWLLHPWNSFDDFVPF